MYKKKKENLYDYFPFHDIDKVEFCKQVELIPFLKRYKHSRSKAIKLRYNHDGSIAHTYSEIAKEFGINSSTQARLIAEQAIRLMRHPKKSQ